MPASLDVTIAGASANSYVDLSEAADYFDARLNVAAWTAASTDLKTRALIQAVVRIDAENFAGEKASTSQALEWPRYNVLDRDGYFYDEGIIPTIVKRAQMEMALALLASDSDGFADSGLERFREAEIGPLRVVVAQGRAATALPDVVERILRPVLKAGGGSRRAEVA